MTFRHKYNTVNARTIYFGFPKKNQLRLHWLRYVTESMKITDYKVIHLGFEPILVVLLMIR